MRIIAAVPVTFFCLLTLAGCASTDLHVSQLEKTTSAQSSPSRPTVYEAPDTVGANAGVGIESQDIISMCDRMMRDMMTNALLANPARPPQVILDASYFRNESANRINLNLITDRLRSGLVRAANGRMIFVGRHASDMVEHERKLKREGVVDAGTTDAAARTLGGDYRLTGRITDLNSLANTSGLQTRFTQIVFEMVDLENGALVWSGDYSFRKTAADDLVYR